MSKENFTFGNKADFPKEIQIIQEKTNTIKTSKITFQYSIPDITRKNSEIQSFFFV